MTMMIESAFFDIDGVLTDGAVYVNADGLESKRIVFDDIDAIFELKRAGVKIGFVTGENNSFTEYVQRRFSPNFFTSGCRDKLSWFRELINREGLKAETSCFVGDSKKDVDLLRFLDFSFVPADVDEQIKAAAKFVLKSSRGSGAIKETVEFIFQKNNTTNFQDGFWREKLSEHVKTVTLMENTDFYVSVAAATTVIINALRAGKKLLLCGNGGSASDSQHIATELVSRFLLERKALDAEALSVNTSSLTAIGNDYNFDKIFSRQVEAKGRSGDVLLGISTSGNSKNVVEAMASAKKVGMKTIGLMGSNHIGSAISRQADICICVPSNSTPRIQECHILIGHMMCEMIEKILTVKEA
jgi:D-sedoheptulose 7-phosphate isomerase